VFKTIFFLVVLLIMPVISGCIILCPFGGIFAHTVQKCNDDYDNIIVNYGYKYREYYQGITAREKERSASMPVNSTASEVRILTFDEWIETQAHTAKEKKAVVRYKRIHANNP